MYLKKKKKKNVLDFPGSPAVKTPFFPCRVCGFDPWAGNSDTTCCLAWPNVFFFFKKENVLFCVCVCRSGLTESRWVPSISFPIKENCFFWDAVVIQYYISFRCTTKWFIMFKGYIPFIVIIRELLVLN